MKNHGDFFVQYPCRFSIRYWKDKEELMKNTTIGYIFKGIMDETMREEKLHQWNKVVKRAELWAQE